MKRVLYFAYGSNLLTDQMTYRLGTGIFSKHSNYRLEGYRLVFNAYGYADIVPDANSHVDGVLYNIEDNALRRLDTYEALYIRKHFIVNDGDDTAIAVVYVGDPQRQRDFVGFDKTYVTKPKLEYVNRILEGAANNGLDELYEQMFAFKRKNFKLKSYKKYK